MKREVLPAAARRSMKPRRRGGGDGDDDDAGVTSMIFLSAKQTANFLPHGDATASVTGDGSAIDGEEEEEEENVNIRPSDKRTVMLPEGG